MIAFRGIGHHGDAWPAWLRALDGRCGVYAIKSHGRVVYVGSSKARLYDTITRHFQHWKRRKKFWAGMRSNTRHDPGTVYDRDACEIAVMTTACGDHLTMEAAWIEKYKPRDNLVQSPDGEGDDEIVPF